MKKIIIQLESTEGTQAYLDTLESIKRGDKLIKTCCLDFFDNRMLDKGYDVILTKESGDYISLEELRKNTGDYTTREIKEGHNVHKLFVNGDFTFKKGVLL